MGTRQHRPSALRDRVEWPGHPVRVNLFGGPGVGKSTLAMALSAELRRVGEPIEYVAEYVKEWAWEGRKPRISDQLYFFAKQRRREEGPLRAGHDIVTDSPLWLNCFYADTYKAHDADEIDQLCVKFDVANPNQINLLLERLVPYERTGRFQSESEAKRLDGALETFLDWRVGRYHVIDPRDVPNAIAFVRSMLQEMR